VGAFVSDTRPGRRTGGKVANYVVLAVLTVLFLGPIVWMVLTSFKPTAEATASPPTFFPHTPTNASYDRITAVGSSTPVFRWFVNSMLAAVLHALLVLATATPAAYALARMEFRGKRVLLGLIIATLFVPPIIFLPPNYMIVERLGWLDTLPAIIVPMAASAFGVFFLRQFFLGMPVELEKAARLDGANRFQTFWHIVLPNAKPALATLGVLSLLTNWNDFLWPVYVLFNPEHLTLGPGLSLLQSANTTDYALVMAGAVVASIPVIAVFVFAQRYIVEGVARTGIKG
jgi:multiple sugar transport system permease protein